MPIALAVISVNKEGGRKRIKYKATFSGNYPTGGDTLDFTKATNAKFQPAPFPSRVPEAIEVDGAPGGLSCEAVLGTGNTDNKLKCFAVGSQNEFAAGAYGAAVTGDGNVIIEAVWPMGV